MEMNYDMRLYVNNVPLPDPSSWEYEVSDLDTVGKRDATGTLVRNRVATKINYSFSWTALNWEDLQTILGMVTSDKFELKAPDPRTFSENAGHVGYYYVGDRTGKCLYFLPGKTEKASFSLKMKFIEY